MVGSKQKELAPYTEFQASVSIVRSLEKVAHVFSLTCLNLIAMHM